MQIKNAKIVSSSHKSKIKIIAHSKNTFQNTNALQISSNINELIETVLNPLFFFTKRFYNYKKAQISK